MITRETATLQADGQNVTYQENQGDQKAKAKILDELYRTGRVDGLYFGKGVLGVKNPIKTYIAGCLYKNRLLNCADLIDDCYNELFIHLTKMEVGKFMSIYRESPNKLIATSLTIISLKCFAIDPRYGNPKHSLIPSILFASSLFDGRYIDHTDAGIVDTDGQARVNEIGAKVWDNSHDNVTRVITSHDYEPTDFAINYGFEITDLVERLSPDERATFYAMADKQKRGKVSAANVAKREALEARIKELIGTIPERTKVGRIAPERKFKGSIYETN